MHSRLQRKSYPSLAKKCRSLPMEDKMDGVENGGLLIPGFSSQKPYHHHSTLKHKKKLRLA